MSKNIWILGQSVTYCIRLSVPATLTCMDSSGGNCAHSSYRVIVGKNGVLCRIWCAVMRFVQICSLGNLILDKLPKTGGNTIGTIGICFSFLHASLFIFLRACLHGKLLCGEPGCESAAHQLAAQWCPVGALVPHNESPGAHFGIQLLESMVLSVWDITAQQAGAL